MHHVADVSGTHGHASLELHHALPPYLQQLQWQGNCRSLVPLLDLQQLQEVQPPSNEQPWWP